MSFLNEEHFVSCTCNGVKCHVCKERVASHKVGEEMAFDDPARGHRHNYTAYVCCQCFRMIMGDMVLCEESQEP